MCFYFILEYRLCICVCAASSDIFHAATFIPYSLMGSPHTSSWLTNTTEACRGRFHLAIVVGISVGYVCRPRKIFRAALSTRQYTYITLAAKCSYDKHTLTHTHPTHPYIQVKMVLLYTSCLTA